jgi:hypothetical protein
MVGFQTCWVIGDVSIPYSAIYTPAHNDGFLFRHKWWLCLRYHVGYHSDPKNNISLVWPFFNFLIQCDKTLFPVVLKVFYVSHMFLQNVGWLFFDYYMLYPRRYNILSQLCEQKIQPILSVQNLEICRGLNKV